MFSAIWHFLSTSLLFWEITGYVCTSVVIAGCVGEYLAEYKVKDADFKHKLSRFSLIILTAGIAGELLTAIQSSRISSGVISDLETSVRSASQSAKDAAADAVRAKSAANDAEVKSGTALDKSSDALQTTGVLSGKLDVERTQLSNLDAKRVELAESINDLTEKIRFRHVSPEQAAKITSALLAAPPGVVEIDILPTAADGDPYCRELWNAIHDGGWTGSFGTTTLLYNQAHDVFVVVKDWGHPPPEAETLFQSLNSAEIKVLRANDKRINDMDEIIVVIGPKPK